MRVELWVCGKAKASVQVATGERQKPAGGPSLSHLYDGFNRPANSIAQLWCQEME